MFQVTRACTRGDIKQCSCVSTKNDNLNDDLKKYEWGGCSDNVFYGYKLAKSFTDSNEFYDLAVIESKRNILKLSKIDRTKEHKLMNLHNNEVGRRVKTTFFFESQTL
jgi:hypothetical protein